MLQYDDSAFYFFSLSTISFYLVPSWYSILSKVCSAFLVHDEEIGAVTRTTVEQQKAETLKKESRGLNNLRSQCFLFNLAITIVFTTILLWLLVSVSTGAGGDVHSFDPYAILGIDQGTENERTIRRAYHQLSLKHHPDKDPNNPAAKAKFVMLHKAYQTLTDPEFMENWKNFGNPDGKQSLEVSIGLPSFLLDKPNRNLVLVAYLVIMVGVIPFCVWSYYKDSSKFGEKDVMYDSYSWYHYTLNEHSIVKSLPEALAGSAEFRKRNMPKTVEEKEEIGRLMSKVRSQMQKPKFNHSVCIKGNILLHAHLLRKTDLLSEQAMDDLKYMLKLSSSLVDAMIAVCKHQDSMKTAMNCIEFGQYLAQAMWIKDSSLLQLPHFTNEEEVKHVEKAKIKCNSILQYRDIPDDQKKGMATFGEEQKQDVYKYLKLFPDITVTSKVFVDDDEDDKVYEGDLCTVRVTITRNHLPENGNAKAGLVHAPRFPFPKQEAWWILLGTKDGKIISIDKVGNPRRVVEHNIKFLAPRKGEYQFDLYVKSNAYVGVDEKQSVELTTLDNTSLPEYKIHPDDAELDDEPTLFEEILNANIEQDSDDEDSDDEDDNEDEKIQELGASGAQQQPVGKKKEQLQKARWAAAADDDDDDDDDEDYDRVEEIYMDK